MLKWTCITNSSVLTLALGYTDTAPEKKTHKRHKANGAAKES